MEILKRKTNVLNKLFTNYFVWTFLTYSLYRQNHKSYIIDWTNHGKPASADEYWKAFIIHGKSLDYSNETSWSQIQEHTIESLNLTDLLSQKSYHDYNYTLNKSSSIKKKLKETFIHNINKHKFKNHLGVDVWKKGNISELVKKDIELSLMNIEFSGITQSGHQEEVLIFYSRLSKYLTDSINICELNKAESCEKQDFYFDNSNKIVNEIRKLDKKLLSRKKVKNLNLELAENQVKTIKLSIDQIRIDFVKKFLNSAAEIVDKHLDHAKRNNNSFRQIRMLISDEIVKLSRQITPLLNSKELINFNELTENIINRFNNSKEKTTVLTENEWLNIPWYSGGFLSWYRKEVLAKKKKLDKPSVFSRLNDAQSADYPYFLKSLKENLLRHYEGQYSKIFTSRVLSDKQ